MQDLGTSSSNQISSSDINGAAVYSPNGEHIGTIDHLTIDKQSGKVSYAVMGFGGFLGLGEEHYPIPWSSLRYDTGKDGYITNITQADLEGAPARTDEWSRDRDWETRTYDHYGVPYYWI